MAHASTGSLPPGVLDAVDSMALTDAGQRGAVFTRPEVVEFILDLVGYTPDKPLHTLRLLEPSFGTGDFLVPAVERLLRSHGRRKGVTSLPDLTRCVRAVELHPSSYDVARERLSAVLQQHGIGTNTAKALLDAWMLRTDFLLADLPGHFDFVVGNPPYLRQERVPELLLAAYRVRYATLHGRADLYIPFIERSLHALAHGGAVGFICADRWMKNRYGQRLRQLVASQFRLRVFVDMVNTSAFKSDVIAYPAITVISREAPGSTRAAYRPTIQAHALKALHERLTAPNPPKPGPGDVYELPCVTAGDSPWLLVPSEQQDFVRQLEASLPTLEEAGCKVGIGVATGADKAFIGLYNDLDVECDRKVPLAMTRDLVNGTLQWRGFGVINPFTDSGALVDLAHYPQLRRYLQARRESIVNRYVAKRNPTQWYRTIDRIYPALMQEPKLLIPDIKGEAHVVYDAGKLYPHHNLYYITSATWDLRALQAVLLSGIARLFVAAYSTRMRGGYLRFQAQYLRRIRLPAWGDVPKKQRAALTRAAARRDVAACNEATFRLYGLQPDDALIAPRVHAPLPRGGAAG